MGNFMKYVAIARKLIGKLTDALIRGRELGLWNRKPGADEVFGKALKEKDDV
jgi:hypothetical protein